MTPRSLPQDRVISLVTGLVVLLPSLWMAALSLRSYRQESALADRSASDQLSDVAEQAAAAANRQVDALLKQAVSQVAALPGPVATGTPVPVLPLGDLPTLGAVVAGDGPVAEERTEAVPVVWGDLQPDVDHLERLVLQHHRDADAAAGWRSLIKERRAHLSGVQEAAAYLRMGDAYAAAGQGDRAVEAWTALFSLHNRLRGPNGCYGLIAHERLLAYAEKVGDARLGATARRRLARGLLLGEWPLSDAEQLHIAAALRGLPDDDPEFRSLMALIDRAQGQRRESESLKTKLLSPVLKVLHQQGWMERGGIVFPAERRDLAVLAAPIDGRRLVLVAAPRSAVEALLVQSTKGALGLEGEQVALAGGARPNAQVSRTSPPLPLAISLRQDLAASGQGRRRLFGVMSGLSALALAAGLFLMVRSAKRDRELAQLKADFVANVSHELRTPLTSIAYIGELLNTGRFRNEADMKEFFGMLTDETSRLRELIDEVLDFAKAMNGEKPLSPETADLGDLTRQAVDRLAARAAAGGFSLKTDLPPGPLLVKVDPRALVRAIMNLVDNAMKYAGTSREVVIETFELGRSAGVRVSDQGAGIPPAELPHVFEKFFRGKDARDRERAGVGLGLAMVKHIVEAHGGTVEVQSTLGLGSRFTILVPRLDAHP